MFKLITPTITNCECSMRNIKKKKKKKTTEYMSFDDLTQFAIYEDG